MLALRGGSSKLVLSSINKTAANQQAVGVVSRCPSILPSSSSWNGTWKMLVLPPSRYTQQQRLFSSSSRQPRFRVPAHVAAFSVLLLPVLAFAAYASRYGPTNEALEEEISKRYQAEQEHIIAKNKQMGDFFQKAILHKNDSGDASGAGAGAASVESQLDALLRGGKGEKKRLHAVDEKLYGTAEGVAEKKRVVEELEEEKKKRKKRKKQRKKKQLIMEEAVNETEQTQKDETPKFSMPHVEVKQVATVAVVATIAAVAGFLLGGNRRSS